MPGTGWTYGTGAAYLRELISYWQNGFDWRAQQARLNTFNHYRASVGGMRIHFVQARSRDANAIPLLLLHGWPSSFVQMLDLIPLLVDPAAHGLPADGAKPPFTPAEQAFIKADAETLSERAYARLEMSKPQTLALRSTTLLPAWPRGSWRHVARGATVTAISKAASRKTHCSRTREPLTEGRIERPVGMLMTTKDLFPAAPREWGERFFNVTRWTETNVGGHFLEWDEPVLVTRELQAFFASVEAGARRDLGPR